MGSIIETIKQIFKVIANLPAILVLIQQIIDLIKGLTGDKEKDETIDVSLLKNSADRLEVKAGLRKKGEMFYRDNPRL